MVSWLCIEDQVAFLHAVTDCVMGKQCSKVLPGLCGFVHYSDIMVYSAVSEDHAHSEILADFLQYYEPQMMKHLMSTALSIPNHNILTYYQLTC